MVQPFANLPFILSRRQKEMVRLATAIVQRAGSAAGTHLVSETPVKRGIARSNWVASIDQRFSAVIPAYAPYPAIGNGPAPIAMKLETANRQAAVAQHTATLAGFNAARHHTVYIQNNARHIAILNQGWSRQTPNPGWFNESVNVAIRAIRGMWRLRK